jgi:hypothetical protein
MSSARRTPGTVELRMVANLPTVVLAGTDRSIADIVGTMPVDTANGDFIVKAWNSHDDLVAALRQCCEAFDSPIEHQQKAFAVARALLAKVGA